MFKFLSRLIKNSSLSLMSLILTGLIVACTFYFYIAIHLPDVSQLKEMSMQVPLRVYTSDGKLIAEFGEKKRVPVKLNEVPKLLIYAVLDTEDQRYYEHRGVDFFSLVRAARVVLSSGKRSQGASTITMQVARNFYLNREKTFSRKLNEILLALKIDRTFSKNEILELYLNKIYLGNRAYGVGAAAQVYYGKNLNELTVAQTAMLAGLPQAPSRDNPIINPQAALERRNHVLERMYQNGHINRLAYKTALTAPIQARYHELQVEVQAPYVAEMVRNEVVQQMGTDAYDLGLKVYTTIDSRLQEAANRALHDGIVAYDQRHGYHNAQGHKVEGAFVALDPKNGAILALTGGFSFAESSYNRAIQAQRQPGSAFKPFIYSAALANGFTLGSVFNDAPVVLSDPASRSLWRPQNDTQRFSGPTRLRKALTESYNLVSIRLLQAIGISTAVDYIKQFGFDSNAVPSAPSLALGTGTLTPLQLTSGYAIFANGGYKVPSYFISTIVKENNKVIYKAQPMVVPGTGDFHSTNAPQVITPQNAYLITSALKDVITKGTARKAATLQRSDLAGKTGTTNDQVDAWFAGYNADIVATVWIGFDQPQSTYEHGAKAALPVWMQFMETALAGKPLHDLPPPQGIVSARIDPQSGLLARSDQTDAVTELFTVDSVPKTIAPIPQSTFINSSGATTNGNSEEPLF
jgi:penicillin-binding protein 1A